MKHSITQPRQGHVLPVSRRIIDEMMRLLANGPEWTIAATVDAAKVRPGQPLDSLTVYLHESPPDAALHPQLAIVERLNPTTV